MHGRRVSSAGNKTKAERVKEELGKRIKQMREERAELRVVLDKYQQEFAQLHNRKIRYKADIRAVEDKFKRYKDLKVEIQTLETRVESQPAN
jgi:predicted RNase H-like nuclease (RuvC/YqgF family)